MRPTFIAAHLNLGLLFACATQDQPIAPHEPGDYQGVEEASEALTDLSDQCSFTAGTGLLTLTLNGDDIALFVRATDGKLLINGFPCQAAAVTAIRKIEVTENVDLPGDETLILDYSGGLFGTGTSGTAGITVDFGQGTGDALKILGSNGSDAYVLGASGLSVNTDANLDVAPTNVEQVVASMGTGNDSFSGAGNGATGAASSLPLELYGGDGNDTLRGGTGADIFDGGEGQDVLNAGNASDGGDTLNGGNGSDTADYSGRAAVTVSIDGLANDGEDGGAEADNVASDVEILKGGTGNDHLTGGAGSQTIFGGAGDDILVGGPGADTLNGDAGDDTFDEGSSPSGGDTMNGGVGIDTVDYSARLVLVHVNLSTALADDGESGEGDKVFTDVENVLGGAGNDVLTGSTLANVLDAGGGDDNLVGGEGNDLLRGGTGNDTLNGGNGNDTFDAADDTGNDTMVGGPGVDLVTYEGRSGGVVVVLDGQTSSGEGGEADKVGADIENLRGGPGDDMLTGNGLDNVLEGGDGTDMIDGGAGDDVIDGDAGDDVIDCGSGDADVMLDTSTGSIDNCELS